MSVNATMEADPSRIYPPQRVVRRFESSKQRCQVIFKFIEMILCIVCMVTINDPVQNSQVRVFITQTTVAICYATYGSHLMYAIVFLVGKLMHHEWPWKSTTALAFIASLLFVICSISLAKDWTDANERQFWPPNQQRLNFLLETAILSAINALVYLTDAILTILIGRR